MCLTPVLRWISWKMGQEPDGSSSYLERLATAALPMLMSALNWGEVFCQSWQRRGEESAKSTLADLSRLPLELVAVDISQVLKAGELKVVHKIPYCGLYSGRSVGVAPGGAGDRRP